MGMLTTLGLLLCWPTNISSSFCYYQLLFRLTELYSTKVHIFGISNSIGLRFGLTEHRIPAQQQALLVGRHGMNPIKSQP
jgi:hypothetical protein